MTMAWSGNGLAVIDIAQNRMEKDENRLEERSDGMEAKGSAERRHGIDEQSTDAQ